MEHLLETSDQFRPALFNTPMLMIDHVSQVLEEGNGRIWVEDAALILLPIAAVQVFGHKEPTIFERQKIPRKGFDNVA